MTSLGNCGSAQPATKFRPIRMRILCLGNELLADDSLGSLVAEHIRQFAPAGVEVLSTPEAGFHLLDYVLNVRRLVVVDTLMTGTAPAGTIYVFHEHELKAIPGGSPHYVGLHETLTLARQLGLPVAEEVFFLAVEAVDCSTLGGEMDPAVVAAVPVLVNLVQDMVRHGANAPVEKERIAA